MRDRRVPAWATAFTLAASAAWAQGAITHVDNIEHIFGASNINAVAGHGRLTAGISREGDVSVLTWPTPSCCDQLLYLSSNALDVRTRPHFGALEGMGITLGLTTGGATHWLHDGSWQITQKYFDDNSLVPVTHFRSDALDLDVEVTDSVDPEVDLLQRHVKVTRGTGAPDGGYALLTYANLSPTLSQIPELPIADWALDSRNDYAAVWDDASSSVVHFHPSDAGVVTQLSQVLNPDPLSYGAFDSAQTPDSGATASSLLAGLAAESGVFGLVTTVPAPSQHQVGFDATPFCVAASAAADNIVALVDSGVVLPVPAGAVDLLRCTDLAPASRGWTAVGQDAWADAADGALEGNPFAAGQVNAALRTELAGDEARVRIAFGATLQQAKAALGGADPEPRSLDTWHAYAQSLQVPTAFDATDVVASATADAMARVTRRALLHDAAGTSRDTGAMVASIARQAPYGLDWPRDGAFFDYALDVAGDSARITRRLKFMASLVRQQALSSGTVLVDADPPLNPADGKHEYPAGAWEMNYYADGTTGGNLRFEIDNTALMVWSMAAHLGYLDEPERSQLAAELYPALAAGADTIAGWKGKQGLNAPASEDDNQAYTSSLHGAVAVYAGLDGAAALARHLHHDDDAQRWTARALELKVAILANLYNPQTGLFRTLESPDGVVNVGSSGADTAWLVWPAELLPFADPRVTQQLTADMNAALAILRGTGEGGQYLAKTFLAGAIAVTHGGDPSLRPLVREGIARLAMTTSTQDTQAFGEVFIKVGAGPKFEPRTSNPHLWAGTLVYLAAMALEHPERFDLERTAFAPPPQPQRCGCAAGDGASGLGLLLLLGMAATRRRVGR
jgi:hypothetical protein